MSDERSLARPATAKEVAAELHELQRADAAEGRRAVLVDIVAQAFGYAETLRQDVAMRAKQRWPVDPRTVPPLPPRLPEALRLSDELFGVERALDGVQAAWREILARPAITRPTSGFGTHLEGVWIEETTTRARREADVANEALAKAAGKLVLAACDPRVRLSDRELARAVERGIASAGNYTPTRPRSPYVKDQARTGDNRE